MKLPHIIKQGLKLPGANRWVQARLVAHGQKVSVDGDFGPATTAAVKRFQRAKRLTADGVVGPQTQTYLAAKPGKVPSKRPSPVKFLPKPRPVKAASIGERAVRTMESWAGRVESPRGSNRVPHLVRLAKRMGWSAGIANMGFSWCDYGLHLALAINRCKTLKASGTWGGHTGMYVPATRAELERLVKAGKADRIAKAKIQRGDILIFFNEGHIGMARGAALNKRTVKTVECNTSSGVGGSQSNGDGCYKRTRNLAGDVDAAYRLKS